MNWPPVSSGLSSRTTGWQPVAVFNRHYVDGHVSTGGGGCEQRSGDGATLDAEWTDCCLKLTLK
jgi:hypothetical protein